MVIFLKFHLLEWIRSTLIIDFKLNFSKSIKKNLTEIILQSYVDVSRSYVRESAKE